MTINGFPGSTAVARGEDWQFRIYVLRFGSDVYRFIFAAKTKSEGDRSFRESVRHSFRRLTLAEIQSAKPLRLKVITVQPGDTVESLSHRMASVDHQLDRFRVLNGLDTRRRDQAARPGQDRGRLTCDPTRATKKPGQMTGLFVCSWN